MSSALTTCGKHNSKNCPMTDKDNVNNIFCDLDRDDNSIDALMNVKGGDSDDTDDETVIVSFYHFPSKII